MYRIGDQMSKTSQSRENSNSNLEECMQNIQSNLKMMYGKDEEEVHLGSYNVNAVSGFHSQFLSNKDDQYDSQRMHYTSQQSNDFMLEDKNKQIRQLNKELADLRKGQQMTQFEQYEHYQKIIDGLKKENVLLQQRVLNNEAVQQLNSDRVIEQQEQLKEYELKLDQQHQQISSLNLQLKDAKDQLKLQATKSQISKQEQQCQSKQYTQIQQEYDELQRRHIKQQQENENMKVLIEQLQNDLDKRLETQSDSQVVEIIEQVLQTISQFVREYDYELQKSEYQYKFSNELKDIIKGFITQRDLSIWQSIDRLSSLIISLFEQLTFDVKQIHSDNIKMKNMTLQIESLEQMTVQLEQTISQYEIISNQQQNYLKFNDDQNKQEKEELVNVLINRTLNDQQMNCYDKMIKNLEEVNQAQQNEIKDLKDKLSFQIEQNQLYQKQYQEEQHQQKIYESKFKKQHYDSLFLKEIMNKLVILIGNETTSKTIEQIQEIQQKVNDQYCDEIDIKSKLEIKEQDLKIQINENKLNMNEMIEKRREIEVLRNTLRNCQKQIEMNKEKVDMLVRDLDHNVMQEKSQQFSVSYLPKTFKKENENLAQKLQKTMRM
ncbi:unnamed protein product (macronuclear) [Paramecium tetraurelia]|uniref:Uncharacterized protein n=1 Tax=Paramecium tetraurelia TaxID=5888 RepID=A0CN13_PARTE|nr:uncharacterized protein GSPATT00008621001 [Paramecium tetraurelia]CAK72180.1 unnamed protein product [Paramecium tetraurelia]|eukprot:XP_001439577.1 hypothetical protein (macronuclear) [Paramecium tetraurelia strain d4-2]